MAEPIKKTNNYSKPATPPVGGSAGLPVVSQLSQATTSTVKNLTAALSSSVNTAKVSLGVMPPTGKTGEKPGKKGLVWVLLLIILALAAGGYYLYTHRTITTAPPTGKNVRTFSTSIVYRASTIPSGVARISGGRLTFEDIQLPIIDPAHYAYTIQLAQVTGTELNGATDVQQFYMDKEGYPTGLGDGMPIANFELGDTSGYNRLRVVLQSIDSEAGILGGVMLDGNLGEGVAVLKFPLDLRSAAGQASFSRGDTQGTTNIGINLTGLNDSELQAYGWRFEGWLAKMNGPLLADVTPLGVFDAVGGGARSNFTAQRDLSGYNKLVISLIPNNSSGGSLVRLLPFSAELTIQ